jgi:hypothetical protein
VSPNAWTPGPALPCLLHSICVHAISMHDGSKPTALAVRHTRQCPGACLGARACTEACCCVVRWTEVDKKKNKAVTYAIRQALPPHPLPALSLGMNRNGRLRCIGIPKAAPSPQSDTV